MIVWTDLRVEFVPRPGTAGFQVSNPSILDLTAVIASLEVFHMTSMANLRAKSVSLTKYLETLLLHHPVDAPPAEKPFTIITPQHPNERGAQLSVKLKPGSLLEPVLEELESNGVVVDERKPDVIRIAPTPLYNTFVDVWDFAQIFLEACRKAVHQHKG